MLFVLLAMPSVQYLTLPGNRKKKISTLFTGSLRSTRMEPVSPTTTIENLQLSNDLETSRLFVSCWFDQDC